MKKFLLPLLLIFAACNSNEETNTTETLQDTIQATAASPLESGTLDSACFIRTEGIGNVDTMALKLFTEGGEAWGKLMYLYHEKDWRMGRFHGSRNGDVVRARWVFLQEGMQDSVDLSFKLQGNSAFQQNAQVDRKTGKETLSDTAAYSRAYQQIDCDKFPKYDFDFGL
jgi:uncharacterized membrane protein